MSFFRRSDVMTGPALVRIAVNGGGSIQALEGAAEEEQSFLDPETGRNLRKTLRIWKKDLSAVPEPGGTVNLAGKVWRIVSVRVWLDFVVIGLGEEYVR